MLQQTRARMSLLERVISFRKDQFPDAESLDRIIIVLSFLQNLHPVFLEWLLNFIDGPANRPMIPFCLHSCQHS